MMIEFEFEEREDVVAVMSDQAGLILQNINRVTKYLYSDFSLSLQFHISYLLSCGP